MPRPKASPEQKRMAYKLWRLEHGHKSIWESLEAEFGESVVSDRTVGTWISEFKQAPSETIDRDTPFQWHLMEDHGLPWEAGEYLLHMWVSTLARPQIDPLSPYKETFRAVRWWWRVHLAAPELSAHEVRSMAGQFEVREVMHDIVDQPLRMEDLDAFLAFRPWSSAEKRMAYLDAVEQGLIPPLWTSAPWVLEERDRLSPEEFFESVIWGDIELS